MMILEKIADILTELSGIENITLETELQDDLMLDSLHMVMLLIALEDKFEIILDESDMNPFNMKTVQDVVDLIEKHSGDFYEYNR